MILLHQRVAQPSQTARLAYVRAALVAALGLLGVAVLGVVVLSIATRMRYPFELSRMEGYFADHVRLAAAGRPLYLPPSAEFIPLLYTPLSYHAAALLVGTGMSPLSAGRAVSLLGVGGTVLIGLWLVVRATGNWWLSLLVPVLAAARYFDVDCYYDQVRPDNLMTFFCVLAVAALTLRSAPVGTGVFVIAGVLAILTKQSAVVFLAVLLAGFMPLRWRMGSACSVVLVVAALCAFGWMDARTHGWLYNYTVGIPALHEIAYRHTMEVVAADLLGVFVIPTAAALLVVTAVVLGRHTPAAAQTERQHTRLVLLAAVLAAGAFSLASSTQKMSLKNVLVPYALVGAIFLPVAVAWAVEQLESPSRLELGWILALLVLCLVTGHGLQVPTRYLPSADDVRVWLEFRQRLQRYGPPERVWVTEHGNVWGAGPTDPVHVHVGALFDYVGGYFGGRPEEALPADLQDRVASQYFDVIVAGDHDFHTRQLIEDRYQPDRAAGDVFVPAFGGYPPARELFWIPKTKQ